jgi:hypothetical protein
MRQSSERWLVGWLAVLAALSLLLVAAACDSGGSRADATSADRAGSDGSKLDGGLPDGAPSDGQPQDGSKLDSLLPDGAGADSQPPDASKPDAPPPDAARPDLPRPDVVSPDTSPPDAVRPDGRRPPKFAGTILTYGVKVQMPGAPSMGNVYTGFTPVPSPVPADFPPGATDTSSLGCYAWKYQRKTQPVRIPISGDAGDVEVSGYTGTTTPPKVVCRWQQLRPEPRIGVYACDPPNIVGEFVKLGDPIQATVAGGLDVESVQLIAVAVPEPLVLDPNTDLRQVNPAAGAFSVRYGCGASGDQDCAGPLIAVSLSTTDVMPGPSKPFPDPDDRFQVVQCRFAAQLARRSATVPAEAMAVLDNGGNWKALRTTVIHVNAAAAVQDGKGNTVQVGAGQGVAGIAVKLGP